VTSSPDNNPIAYVYLIRYNVVDFRKNLQL